MKRHTSVLLTPSGSKLRRGALNWLSLLLFVIVFAILAISLSSCKAWRTISTTATYSTAPDKSGNPVTTISTKTVEEYQGAKKN